MIIGDKSPHMKFNHDAIKIETNSFNPDKEIGTSPNRYSDESCYKKHFVTCDKLGQLIKDTNKIFSDKFGKVEKHHQVQAKSGHVLTVFQGSMKESLKHMKKGELVEDLRVEV